MQNSLNKYDIYKWVKTVIDSCVTYPQLVVANRLIHLHFKMFKDEYLWDSLNAYYDWSCNNLVKN